MAESDTAEILAILDRCGAAARTARDVEEQSNAAVDALTRARPEPRAAAELVELCRTLTIRTR